MYMTVNILSLLFTETDGGLGRHWPTALQPGQSHGWKRRRQVERQLDLPTPLIPAQAKAILLSQSCHCCTEASGGSGTHSSSMSQVHRMVHLRFRELDQLTLVSLAAHNAVLRSRALGPLTVLRKRRSQEAVCTSIWQHVQRASAQKSQPRSRRSTANPQPRKSHGHLWLYHKGQRHKDHFQGLAKVGRAKHPGPWLLRK